MGALLLPQGVIDTLDAPRRAFLWAGEESVSGAQCLVSWGRACLPKEDGGLGVRDLSLQNTCLLMKLLHPAHNATDSAWASGLRSSLEDHWKPRPRRPTVHTWLRYVISSRTTDCSLRWWLEMGVRRRSGMTAGWRSVPLPSRFQRFFHMHGEGRPPCIAC
ncbi:hypothetical protein PR202_gb12776 [Eleusine coracana subsp. coracana]|uniref:Uncharacterized protein n=1 Tax=Eleusine coracana subsp. coracana TaxID=191504 RepID=A0AAV5EQS8_ELECO|nr:hypothetical protein PR202_gb12776 [Eleusine coracana subsp. coracana]